MQRGDKIFANTPSDNSTIGFNELFLRLETLRNIHQSASGQTNASSISNSFNTNVAVEGAKITPSTVEQLNNDLNYLKQSSWYVSDTSSSQTTLETEFNSTFPIPSIGQLITAGSFQELNIKMQELESVCPVYTGRYTSRYTSRYSGRYSQYGQYSNQYSGQYSGRYSGQYSGRYSGQYSGRYSGRYSGQYSGRYSNKYSGQYSGRYTGKYTTKYANRYSGRYSRYHRYNIRTRRGRN